MLGGDPEGWSFKDWCWELWGEKHGVKAPWLAKDFVHLAKVLKACESEDVARAAWRAYLASTNPFYEGKSPAKFLSSLSEWVVKSIPKNFNRPSIVKKAESFPGAARAAKMVEILKEVEADDTIPSPMKRDEMARRWREIPTEI